MLLTTVLRFEFFGPLLHRLVEFINIVFQHGNQRLVGVEQRGLLHGRNIHEKMLMESVVVCQLLD